MRYQAPLELVQSPKLTGRLHDTLAKPFVMFVLEPMLIATTFYLAVSACGLQTVEVLIVGSSSSAVACTCSSRRTLSSSRKATTSLPVREPVA